MNPALALANRKLYHASLHLRLLRGELEREDIPAAVLLEALGESVQFHLRQAYGAFLLVLAGREPDGEPLPGNVAELVARYGLEEPLRGELVELAALEQGPGWLGELLRSAAPAGVSPPFSASSSAPAASLAVEAPWSEARLEEWQVGLTAQIDRMGDSLDEW